MPVRFEDLSPYDPAWLEMLPDTPAGGVMHLSRSTNMPRSLVLHEVQHALQGLEGFAYGTAPEAVSLAPGTPEDNACSNGSITASRPRRRSGGP